MGTGGEVLVVDHRRVVRRSCVGEGVERATSLRRTTSGGSVIGMLHPLHRLRRWSPLCTSKLRKDWQIF
jgi:hypothetical protein